jgi:GAF domain-containing protein
MLMSTPDSNNPNGELRGQPSVGTPAIDADRLAGQLGELARALEHEQGLDQTLAAVVHAAVTTVPGAQYASISSVQQGREVKTLASTGDLAAAVDQAQYDTGQGPCLDSLYQQRTVRLPNVPIDQRWPLFAERAAELGVHSMLALQLFVDGEDLGALNLLSKDVDAFDDESEHIGLLFATHAAVAMAGARQRDQLMGAADTRNVIGQAQGILMERFNIPADRAFSVLVRYSQTLNRKLRDIAEELASDRSVQGSDRHPAAIAVSGKA